MKYLKLFINVEEVLANDESYSNVLELIKELQDKDFFNENGLIQYEDEQESELKSILEKYLTINENKNEE